MKLATISQTKNRLSALLEFVRRGETILILDRNKPIAQIVPLTAAKDSTKNLDGLESAGLLRKAQKKLHKQFFKDAPKSPKGVSVLTALLADRSEDDR